MNDRVKKALNLYLDDSEWDSKHDLNYKLQCLMIDHLQTLKRGSWKGSFGREFSIFDEMDFMDMIDLIVEIREKEQIVN
ncbi:hypothetical protein ACQKNX_07920 [Lysinibacillus sp. NPDC093712]|uniref:hypothetical protein n=1 Tax=Lysinibacillus sp. NPDC093712 TaxID=3390579 RepID=UPI003D05C565